MKRLLLTGGCGFIGSEVVRKAISKDFVVMNLDKLTYASNVKNISTVSNHPNYHFSQIDICDVDRLNEVFTTFKPDCCIHLAAESHVDRSISKPQDFINTNVVGTMNMLNCSLVYWQQMKNPQEFRFLHVSTDEVYGSLKLSTEKKFTEASPYNPSSPYSASKAASDHLVMAWIRTYGLPAMISNCSNNYGPYQNEEKLIPATIIRALKHKPLHIYGDGKNVRDWLHVSDHANALFAIIEKGTVGHTYCVGANTELNNLTVVHHICDSLNAIMDAGVNYRDLISFVTDRPGHDRRYAIDSTFLMSQIGWMPAIEFEDGIRDTINWYVDNESWWG
jgi:dTDP-glucose 4,6-dehydratase